MKHLNVKETFSTIMKSDPDVSAGVAAIQTLLQVLGNNKAGTIQELDAHFREAIAAIKETNFPVTSVTSGCELFMRFITLATLDSKDFEDCKAVMIKRGELFLQKLSSSRAKVSKLASSFVTEGCKILTHSKSRVVLEALREASRQNKRFEVFVTRSSSDKTGEAMCKDLEESNIPCTVVLDSAVGYIMESVDMVMVGAEGVVESGGIINKIGSYTMAICAREASKPFYVLTESFKFVRLYPLNQRDLPPEFKYGSTHKGADVSKLDPLVDYTPPSYISLLFTDLGILTPSAVSDELIKLYL